MIEKRKYPYFAEQTWRDIFFFNWPVDDSVLAPHIPKPFKLDLYARQAWITLVLFKATNSRFRVFPSWTSFPQVTQMNVRTYVYSKASQEKGVYFLSISLSSMLAKLGGKNIFWLPFRYKNVHMEKTNGQVVVNDVTENLLKFFYQLTDVEEVNLAEFLTERYCIWNVKGKKLIKIPILHPKWTVQKCITEETETKLFTQLKLPRITPLTYYCEEQHAQLFPYEKCGYVSY